MLERFERCSVQLFHVTLHFVDGKLVASMHGLTAISGSRLMQTNFSSLHEDSHIMSAIGSFAFSLIISAAY